GLWSRLSRTMVCTAETSKTFSGHLSPFVKPSHYRLRLKPCLQTFTVTGKVEIDVDIMKETPEIILHSDVLHINSVDIKTVTQNFSDVSYHFAGETITLMPLAPLAVGKATIAIQFTGELRRDMQGFYRSSYQGEDGREKTIATTHFDSGCARLAFPCFDEPSFKARFDVELVVKKTITALSNMNVVLTDTEGDGFKMVRFATTPLMSTHLLSFAVGELKCSEATTKQGTTVRVYTTPVEMRQDKCSIDVAKRALEWYAEWFAIRYALPKCDLIAIPDMGRREDSKENWGANTFPEIDLPFNNFSQMSNGKKGEIELIAAHELAHFWFANLITNYWWTDLSLREGFVSIMDDLFVGRNYEEYQIRLRLARKETTSVRYLDVPRNPLQQVPHGSPNELDEIYYPSTYTKSNRMLCKYMGEEKFQERLRLYLARRCV
ncbi:hypothetical protein PENTCL1PPCAC_1556, partial [Pristionchus entomophagus]